MKYPLHSSTICAFILLSFVGCTDQGVDAPQDRSLLSEGSVAMSLEKSLIPSEVVRIVACLSRENVPSICQSVNVSDFTDSVRVILEPVPLGNWDLTVTAFDLENRDLFAGRTVVEVKPRVTTRVILLLEPVSQTGRIEIRILWAVGSGSWTMDSQNPVLRQTIGGWDEDFFYIQDCWILKENSTYKMWYTTGTNARQRIAYATSTDGRQWVKGGIVFDGGDPGSWIESGVSNPAVFADVGVYHMWFNGKTASNPHNGIGYASSVDGISWEVYPNPVIPVSTLTPQVFCPAVLKTGGIYRVYYSVGHSSAGAHRYDIRMRAGSDPRNLGPEVFVFSGDPSLWWQSEGVYSPQVLLDGSRSMMYFTAANVAHSFVGRAVSEDGIQWQLASEIPEVGPWDTDVWRTTMLGFPHVMQDEGRLKMWFAGLSIVDQKWQIGYAEQ